MSSLWLGLALVGTFLTIMVVGIVIDMFLREKHRPVTLLQAQVGQVEHVPDLREEALQGSAFQRAVVPGALRLGRAFDRLMPYDMHKRVDQLLVYAGSPAGWDAERVISLKIIGAIGGVIVGLFVGALLPWGGALLILVAAFFAVFGYLLPGAYVGGMARKRQKEIQRSLPDVMDLLTISVEAGLGFDAALAQVVKNVPGSLSHEIGRLLQEMQIGVSRADAFRHLADRTDVDDLRAFVLSMIQADLFGVSIANVLRAQAHEQRQKRRQRAEEIAMKIPVKIIFPLIFCVLPALFVVILGPGIITAIRSFRYLR
jgi:tight adherence protein C